MMCHPTRAPAKLVNTRTPPSMAEFHERSGSPRLPCRRLADIPDWKLGVEKIVLRPPPVATGAQSSFQTAPARPVPVLKLRHVAAQVLKGAPQARHRSSVACG